MCLSTGGSPLVNAGININGANSPGTPRQLCGVEHSLMPGDDVAAIVGRNARIVVGRGGVGPRGFMGILQPTPGV